MLMHYVKAILRHALNFLDSHIPILVSLIFLFLLYFVIYQVIRTAIAGKHKLYDKSDMIISGIISVALTVILMILVLSEKRLYTYDAAHYWYRTVIIGNRFFSRGTTYILTILQSINNDIYNSLLALILAPWVRLLGNSYPVFELVQIIMFLIPTIWISSLLIMNIVKDAGYENVKLWYIFTAMSTCYLLYLPIMDGKVGIAGLLCASSAFLLCYTWKLGKVDLKKCVYLSVLLIYALFFRKYYAYLVVGFVVFLFFYWLFSNFKDKKKLKISAINYISTGIISCLILFTFFYPFIKNILLADYADMYEAYNTISNLEKVKGLFNYIGFVYLVIIVLGIVISFKNKKLRLLISTLLISIVMELILIYKVQSLSMHHYNIIAIQICILIGIGISCILSFLSKIKWLRTTVAILMLCGFVINFTQSLSITKLDNEYKLMANVVFVPEIREDIHVIKEMDAQLIDLHEQGYDGGVYVLETSKTFNNDMLRKLYAPRTIRPYKIIISPLVDKRDGFQVEFFDADIVTVSDPQYTQRSEHSKVVWSLYSEFIDDASPIRDNYKLYKSYTLDNDVTVDLYLKINEYTEDEILYLKEKFNEYYSDYPRLFSRRFDKYIADQKSKQ